MGLEPLDPPPRGAPALVLVDDRGVIVTSPEFGGSIQRGFPCDELRLHLWNRSPARVGHSVLYPEFVATEVHGETREIATRSGRFDPEAARQRWLHVRLTDAEWYSLGGGAVFLLAPIEPGDRVSLGFRLYPKAYPDSEWQTRTLESMALVIESRASIMAPIRLNAATGRPARPRRLITLE